MGRARAEARENLCTAVGVERRSGSGALVDPAQKGLNGRLCRGDASRALETDDVEARDRLHSVRRRERARDVLLGEQRRRHVTTAFCVPAIRLCSGMLNNISRSLGVGRMPLAKFKYPTF
jgi:hypothetical protein